MINLNKYYIKIYFALLSFLFLSCSNKRDKILISEFDNFKWQQDSLACGNYRFKHYDILCKNQQYIIGKDEEIITHYLGKANRLVVREKSKSYYFYIAKGEQCVNNGNKLKLTQNKLLELHFKNGKLENVNVQIP